eukprot:TRINITY_DN2791_c0_g1_i1.p1 TRINITY_DN2791_c0_g1~~TRINITY_DN2791_c0_g1_i1.p1  ORF type:complete len:176 (-),score=16.05 TRINITY_DN2791_c0_g1_i1:338-865(-)
MFFWLFQIIIVVLFLVGQDLRDGNAVYDTNILLDMSVALIISIAFMIYGIRLTIKNANLDKTDPQRAKNILKVCGTTVIFTICFLLRCIMYSYRFITGQYIEPNTFVVLTYFVPELIPCLIQFYLVETSKQESKTGAKFISDLYSGEVDSTYLFPKKNSRSSIVNSSTSKQYYTD